MEVSVIEDIGKLLLSPRKIVIASHVNPDGDSVGSSLGLQRYLEGNGHQVHAIIPNEFPPFLHWMPGCDKILIYRNNARKCQQLIRSAEIIFCLDFNALNRLDAMEKPVRESDAVTVLLDHHTQPVFEFDHMISVVDTSSTAEIVFEFMTHCGHLHLIDKQVAECIYTGIMTDTGSFSYACNYERTFMIVARLIAAGIDTEHIHRLVYDTYTESRMRLLGYALSEKLKVFSPYHAAYISLTKEELRRFGHQIGDTEGIVNYALSIKGVNLAVLVMEREKQIRLSFRSKGHFSVNEVARLHFNGGGHRNAAGGTSTDSMEQTIKRLEDGLALYADQLDY